MQSLTGDVLLVTDHPQTCEKTGSLPPMPESDFTVIVERVDDELLVLDGLALARAFFTGDASSVGVGSYDSLAGVGNPARIELDDVIAMNRTMRARSPYDVWTDIIEGEAPWLASIPCDLGLLEPSDAEWTEVEGDDMLAAALAAMIGPGRGMSVATKVLHLKRPRLFPVLDRFVAEMLGINVPDQPSPAQRLEIAARLTAVIRREGRRNLAVLRRIHEVLAAEGSERPLVRVFDAILWFSHPAAGVPGVTRVIDVRLRAN